MGGTKKEKTCWISLFIFLISFIFPTALNAEEGENQNKKSLSAFPILMYDSDIGIGYGGKVKFVNYLFHKESLDAIVFNSSKGERWYVLTFSIPDTEIRQGTQYKLSLDIKAEYNKFLKYYFYGTSPNSQEADETQFTYEKKELQFTIGRGFTEHLVMEIHYVLKNIHYFNIVKNPPFSELLETVGEQFSPYASLVLRYDTSDSRIHPKRGESILLQSDLATEVVGNKNASFHRLTVEIRKFQLLFGEKDVLAFRGLFQKISGSDIPLFEMSVLGGGSTLTALRGFKMNRFIDKGKWLLNTEYRFPLWKKLGGNLFVESGAVWPSLSGINLSQTKVNAGWGLRYYLENFVVRFDMGFSQEGTGIYFNFGHIF
jgi:hypothetical protein